MFLSRLFLPILLLISLSISKNSFAQGVSFFQGTWEETIKYAENNNKYILIDAYTDWCAWCKVMDRKTFSDSAVGEFYNKNFVPFKMNMEKEVGIKISQKYRVSGFPSFLYFNPNGKLVYKEFGYQNPEDFINTGKKALDPKYQINYPSSFENLDLISPDFYLASFKGKWPKKDTIINYLSNQEDLFSEINWSIMSRFSLNEKYNQLFLDNIDKYEILYGKDDVEDKVYSIVTNTIKEAIKDKDDLKMEEALLVIEKHITQDKELNQLFYKIRYYEELKNWVKVAENIEAYIDLDKYNSISSINDFCWNIYLEVEDITIIKKAAKWMEQAILLESDYIYVDTYAALLFKGGDLLEAEKYTLKAIEIGKKNKEDVKTTEELLLKIKSQMK